MKNRVYIIAEACSNHNGDLEIAKKMVDVAVGAKADAIKFQAFKSEQLVSRYAPKAEYQKKNTGTKDSQFKMLKDLELSEDAHIELIKYCKKKKITYLCTPFDIDSVSFLSTLGLKVFKIPSGEITNLPYLRKIGSLGKKIIMSTGMATLREIGVALNILIKSGTPKKNITVLHCNTEYPSPFEDVNLLAMLTIKNAFKLEVGYSDHTLGIEIPIAAASLGAKIIEKHFTMDRNMVGPDHRASLEPDELKEMVRCIRNIEKGLGNGIKRPSPSEFKNTPIARKSIIASADIKKGERFSRKNITTKRPGSGISPMNWDKVIANKAKRDFKKDELIKI